MHQELRGWPSARVCLSPCRKALGSNVNIPSNNCFSGVRKSSFLLSQRNGSVAWKMKLAIALPPSPHKTQHSCPSASVPGDIRPPWTSWGELEASVQFLLPWLLGAGKSLLPCSPFHTSSCDSPSLSVPCQQVGNEYVSPQMAVRKDTCAALCLPAPGSSRPGRRWSQDRDSRQRRPSAQLMFLVMRGEATG